MRLPLTLLLLAVGATSQAQTVSDAVRKYREHDALVAHERRIIDAAIDWRDAKKISSIETIPDQPAGQTECLNPSELQTGQRGLLEYWNFSVLQILGDQEMLLANGKRLVMLTRWPTEGFADGDSVRLVGPALVAGTRSYQSVLGSNKTVFEIQMVTGPVAAELAAAQQETEFRTWTSADGTYTTEARFDAFRDGKVVLVNREGKTVELPPAKLGRADQQFYRDELKRRLLDERRRKFQ